MRRRSVLAVVAAGVVVLILTVLTMVVTQGVSVRLTLAPAFVVLVLGAAAVAALARELDRREQLAARVAAAEQQARDRAQVDVAAALAAARSDAADERARLLSRIDHELKNPVMALSLARSTLAAPDASGAERDRALELIAQQTDRLTGLLGGLRKVADLEHRTLDLEDVDLAEVLTEVRQTIAETEAGRQREWALGIPKAPWPVPRLRADADLVFLAVHNLADNAVKYTRPGDDVELRVSEDPEGWVLVEVADTGAGIPAEEVVGVWEEMSRASTARGIPGQGLGLPLVRSVAARHGGRVELRSRVGEGTVVRLWLPVAGPAV